MQEQTFPSPIAAPMRAARSRTWVRLVVLPLVAGLIIGLAIGVRLDVAPSGVPQPRITLTGTTYESPPCRSAPTDDPFDSDGVYYFRAFNVTLTLSNTGNADGFAYVRIIPDAVEAPHDYFVPWSSQVTKSAAVVGAIPFRELDECTASWGHPVISLIGYDKADPQIALTDTKYEPSCTESPSYLQVYRFTFVLVNTGETDGIAVVSFDVAYRHVGQVQYSIARLSQTFETVEIKNDRSLVDGSSFDSSRSCHLFLSFQGYARIGGDGT